MFREQWGLVRANFTIDHFLPISIYPEATVDYHKLVYACAACNCAKGGQLLTDPCKVLLGNDVRVHDDGTIHASKDDARRLIRLLGLDDPEFVEFRLMWLGIIELASRNNLELFQRLMGYPENLPNLSRLKPPGGNSLPEGVKESYYAQRQKGVLPATY